MLLYRKLRYGYAFRRIPVTQGKYTIVDPEDCERLNRYKWHVTKNSRTFYAKRNAWRGRKASVFPIYMHRRVRVEFVGMEFALYVGKKTR